VQEQISIFPHNVEGPTAQVHEIMEVSGGLVSAIYDIGHVRS